MQEWTELVAHYLIDVEDDEEYRYLQFIPGSRNPVRKLDWQKLFEDVLPDYEYDPKYITDITIDYDDDLLTNGSRDLLRFNVIDSLDRLDVLDLERTIPELIAFDWRKHPKGISNQKSLKHLPYKLLYSDITQKKICWADDIILSSPAFTSPAKLQKALQLFTKFFYYNNIRVNQKNIMKLTTRPTEQFDKN